MDSACENTYNNSKEQVAANNRQAARIWAASYGMKITADGLIQYTISRPPGGLHNDVMKALAYIILKEDKEKAQVPVEVSPIAVGIASPPVVETMNPYTLKKYKEYLDKIGCPDLVDCSDARSDFIEHWSIERYLRRKLEATLAVKATLAGAHDKKPSYRGIIYTSLGTVKGGYKPIIDLYNKMKPSSWKPIFEGRFCEGGFEMALEDEIIKMRGSRYNDPNDLVRQVRWNRGKLESGSYIGFKPCHTALLFDVLVQIWGPENVQMI